MTSGYKFPVLVNVEEDEMLTDGTLLECKGSEVRKFICVRYFPAI